MAKLEHNTEALKAWCLRHGADPSRIIDEPYTMRKLPDGKLLYRLRRFEGIDDRYSTPGEPITSIIELTVSADDPMPPRYNITGAPPTHWTWVAVLDDVLPTDTAREPGAVADYIRELQRRLIERS